MIKIKELMTESYTVGDILDIQKQMYITKKSAVNLEKNIQKLDKLISKKVAKSDMAGQQQTAWKSFTLVDKYSKFYFRFFHSHALAL